jgi:protease I
MRIAATTRCVNFYHFYDNISGVSRMTRTTLSGQKIAIMVSNGFDEKNFVEIQKMLMTQNAGLKVVSANSGLVNGRNGDQAGISYPVDSLLSDTLAIDYDALVIPSGRLHTAALKDELHAIRIIRAFLREGMPVLVQDDALDVICEINNEIDSDSLRAGTPLASIENIVWASLDATMSEVSRVFVATCLRLSVAIAEDGSAAA